MSEQPGIDKLKIQVDYAQHAGQVFWSRFNVFSALSGLLLVAWANQDGSMERSFIAVAGLLAAASWLAINARASLYFRKTMRGVKELAVESNMRPLAEGINDSDLRDLAPSSHIYGWIISQLSRPRMTWTAVGVSAGFSILWVAVLVCSVVDAFSC